MSRDYSPNVVASSFIKQYYEMMIKSPENLHKFYNVDSHFMHSDLANPSGITSTGPEAIRQTLAELNLKYTKLDLTNGYVDAQKSANNGVFVLVVGALTHQDSVDKPFVQSFLLSNQGSSSYYVSNSVFRLLVQTEEIEEQAAVESSAPAPVEVAGPAAVPPPAPTPAVPVAVEEPVAPTAPEPEPVVEEEVPSPAAAVVDESSAVDAGDVTVDKVTAEAETAAPAPVAAPADPLRKLNYSDIVKKVNSTVAPTPIAAAAAPAVVPSPAPTPAAAPVPHKITTTAPVVPATVYAVYVKQLPEATTSTELAELFSQFGNVVAVDYLPVRSFAFVKYDTLAAANAAVAGSKGLMLHGQPVRAEERNVSRAAMSSSGAGGGDRAGGPGGRYHRPGGRDGGRDGQRDYRSGDRRNAGQMSGGANHRPMGKTNTSSSTSAAASGVPVHGKAN